MTCREDTYLWGYVSVPHSVATVKVLCPLIAIDLLWHDMTIIHQLVSPYSHTKDIRYTFFIWTLQHIHILSMHIFIYKDHESNTVLILDFINDAHKRVTLCLCYVTMSNISCPSFMYSYFGWLCHVWSNQCYISYISISCINITHHVVCHVVHVSIKCHICSPTLMLLVSVAKFQVSSYLLVLVNKYTSPGFNKVEP